MFKKGKIFENLGKNVQNLKIFWKRAGAIIACNKLLEKAQIGNITLKKTGNSYFCVTQKKSSFNVCPIKILKSTVIKKVTVCFYNLGEENF